MRFRSMKRQAAGDNKRDYRMYRPYNWESYAILFVEWTIDAPNMYCQSITDKDGHPETQIISNPSINRYIYYKMMTSLVSPLDKFSSVDSLVSP